MVPRLLACLLAASSAFRFSHPAPAARARAPRATAADEGTPQPPIWIVFGRPGAGKTTIANDVVDRLGSGESLALDLDVCVPQWMRDNFANGVCTSRRLSRALRSRAIRFLTPDARADPTLEQREAFAREACDYVDAQLAAARPSGAVVSFSFVNTDLRDVFRERFPRAAWLLVDTAPAEASRRIAAREGHFYAGAAAEEEAAADSDWAFAPVAFEHTRLDGAASVRENADAIIAEIQAAEMSQSTS